MVGLEDVPRAVTHRSAQERRAGDLVADELRPLRARSRGSGSGRLRAGSGRGGGAAARRASPSIRPRTASRSCPADTRWRRPRRGRRRHGRSGPAMAGPRSGPRRSPRVPEPVSARLLAATDPDPHPKAVTCLRDEREQLAVLLAPTEELVIRHQPVGRARGAPVAFEAGPDEATLGEVVTGEHGADPLEERSLGQRAGGREEAEHGPLDAVGQRQRRGCQVVGMTKPPAARLDLDQSALSRRAELVANQSDEPLHDARRCVGIRGRTPKARRVSAGRDLGRGSGELVALHDFGRGVRICWRQLRPAASGVWVVARKGGIGQPSQLSRSVESHEDRRRATGRRAPVHHARGESRPRLR